VRHICRVRGIAVWRTVGAGGSSPCPMMGREGRKDSSGAAAELSSDEARVGRVRMGPAELQRDRSAGRAAEAARDLVEWPGGHVDCIDRYEHVLLGEGGRGRHGSGGRERGAESRIT
jgi:hypothetical protein